AERVVERLDDRQIAIEARVGELAERVLAHAVARVGGRLVRVPAAPVRLPVRIARGEQLVGDLDVVGDPLVEAGEALGDLLEGVGWRRERAEEALRAERADPEVLHAARAEAGA